MLDQTNFIKQQIAQLTAEIEKNQLLLNDSELKELAKTEITELESQVNQLNKLLVEKSTVESSEPISQSAILEFRSGTGGDEAKIWADDLMRMYLRFAESVNWKVSWMDDYSIKIRGKLTISDETELTAYQLLRYEAGVHRVQRIPSTENQGRIHTSTASIAVLPEISPQQISIHPEDLTWNFTRAGGAGGQNVNKVNSAVELTHIPSGIKVESRRERYQERNRELALELLRSKLFELSEEKRQSTLSQARSIIGRSLRSEKIKTYNFPQNRLTDHRILKSWHSLSVILEGDLRNVLLETKSQIEALEKEAAQES